MSPSPTETRTPAHRRKRPRPRLIIVLAALILAATACSSGRRSGGAPASSSSIPPSTTTTEPPPQYSPSPFSWDRSTTGALAVGGGPTATLSAVLAPELAGPWLLFGSRIGTGDAPDATVWSSPDAVSWTPASLGSATEASQALAAARYKELTVAVGSTGEGADQQAAVWTTSPSASGFIPESVPASNGPSEMTLVTAGSLGLFATGTVDGRFAMWSSTNGRQWSELPSAEKVIDASPGARVNALLANGDNVFAAGSLQSGPSIEAALWTTSDGLHWKLVGSAAASFSGPGARVIYSLAPLGTGLVAVGALDQGEGWVPASWISPDGQSWSLPSVDFPAIPHSGTGGLGPSGGAAARSVSAIPTLVGSTSVVAAGGGPYGQAAWQSSDGLHWNSLSLPASDAAATSWRAEVAAGTINTAVVLDAEPGQPYLLTDRAPQGAGTASLNGPASSTASASSWVQPSANPTVFGTVRPQAVPVSLQTVSGRLALSVDLVERPQVVGPARVVDEVLLSSDGRTWTRATGATALTAATALDPPTRPVTGALAAHLPSGWVAVSPPSATVPLVWTSTTGTQWTKLTDLAVPVAPGTVSGSGSATTSNPSSPAGSGSAGPSSTVEGLCTERLPASPATATTTTSPSTTASGGSGPGSARSGAARYEVVAVGSSATTAPAPAGTGGVTGGVTGGATGSAAGGGAAVASIAVTTRTPAVWVSGNGRSWRSGAVGGGPVPGATQTMSGCIAAGGGLAAYGTATSAGTMPGPAVWRSTDGTSWSRVAPSAFTSAGPGALVTMSPLVSLAADGNDWLAAANPDPTADPTAPGLEGAAGPASATSLDAGVGPVPSVEDGRDGLWLSTDGGGAWQVLDTSAAPWLGTERAELDLVGFAGGPGGAPVVPVVVGVVDDQLAVWTGTSSTPTASAPAVPASASVSAVPASASVSVSVSEKAVHISA